MKKLIFLCAFSALAQQGPDLQPAQVIRSETRLVLVDTVVTDKKGNYIRDLTQKDFKVFEDGKEQTIATLSHETAGPEQKHYTVLFFDNTTASPVLQAYARAAAAKFIDANTGPNKLMAIAELTVGLKMTQTFTDDPDQLKQAVAGTRSASSNAGNSAALNDYAIRSTLGAVRDFVRGLGSLPGRKTLIYVAGGYPASSTTINEISSIAEAANRANVAVYPLVPSTVIPSGTDASGASDGTAAAPRGRRGGGGGTERADTSAAGIQGVLYNLASASGGFVIDAASDLSVGMARIGKEQEEYYIIGYTPSKEAAPGVCHTLKVKVDKGGEVVRSRAGYCEAKTQDVLSGTPTERDLEARMAANATPTITGASMLGSFVYTAANTARVDVALELPAGVFAVEKDKGKFRATLNLVGVAYLPDGGVKARFSDSVQANFDDKKQADAFAAKPYHYEKQFRIAPGTYNFRLVFTSGPNRFGRLDAPLSIEAWTPAQFGLSALTLSRSAVPGRESGVFDPDLPEDYTPLNSGNIRVVPTASNRFHKGEKCFFYAELYEPALADAKAKPEEIPAIGVHVELLDAKTGKLSHDYGVTRLRPPTPGATTAVPMAMQLGLADMEPGEYRLRVTALDAKDHTAVRTADLTLEK